MKLIEVVQPIDHSEKPQWAKLADKLLKSGKTVLFSLYPMKDALHQSLDVVETLTHKGEFGMVMVYHNTGNYRVRSDDYWRWTITKLDGDTYYLHMKN